jgi:RNA polymerase sigma-70 factor (sigma-E family)
LFWLRSLHGVEAVAEVGVPVGEGPTFDAYVQARWIRLVRSAALLGADYHAAEDLVQTALTRCFMKWERVSSADDPDSYVHRVLINTIRSANRRHWRREMPTEQVPEFGIDAEVDLIDRRETLMSALGRLKAGQREVVVLRYFADLTESQTAEVLGISHGTVKSRCSRAIAALAADPSLREMP